MSETATWRETARRPDGRLYRARKRPRARFWGDGAGWSDDDWGVIVERTHDVDVATALAFQAMRFYGVECNMPPPRVGWTKLVPWDEYGTGADYTWVDVPASAKGAVPSVSFFGTDVPVAASRTDLGYAPAPRKNAP
jgi:hypothetical protein